LPKTLPERFDRFSQPSGACCIWTSRQLGAARWKPYGFATIAAVLAGKRLELLRKPFLGSPRRSIVGAEKIKGLKIVKESQLALDNSV